jgi:hypothetical protein
LRNRVATALPAALSGRFAVAAILVVGLLGFTVTTLFADRLSEQPGVYWASKRVTILAPQSLENPNQLQLSLRSINMTAGMVAQLVSEDRRATRPVEPEMPLANYEVSSGWSVEQPDRGGQWSHQYSDPYVTIQVVDPDPRRVEQLMTTLEERVDSTITEIQQEADVAPVNQFTTTTSPPTTSLFYQAGSPARAIVGIYLLGLGLTALLLRGTIVLGRARGLLGPRAMTRATPS